MSSLNEQSLDNQPKFAGASPAVPRDPRLLEAERAEFEAQQAVAVAEAAKAAAEEAAAKAAAAQANAERSQLELAAAREEAKAKAQAAALQVRMEQDAQLQELAQANEKLRAERDEILGKVATVEDAPTQVVTVTKNSTDGFFGAFGLFIVRVVLAGFIGIVGWQATVNRPAVIEALNYVGVPESNGALIAMFLGIVLMVVGVVVLFGLFTRVVSAILLICTGAFLGFFRFGPFSPFMAGKFGFYGDREVLLATLFFALTFLGAGGWSIDGFQRRKREREKLAE